MGRIAVLVPREDMRYQAHNVLQEKAYDIDTVQVIRTEEAVAAARTAAAQGAKIVVARGLQASLIKQYTDIPVAEIVVTAQELGLLVVRAKEIVKKETPVIAVVGFRNMFSDMSLFNTIYDIELRSYFAASNSLLEAAAEEAAEDAADLMIGGEVATETAKRHGIPSLFLATTEDALRRAFDVAQRMLFALEKEAESRVIPAQSEDGLPSYYRARKPVLRREGGRRKPALVQFSDLQAQSAAMRQCVEKASRYARLDMPVRIDGEPGTERTLLAQCMHHAGMRSDASFLTCSCCAEEAEQTGKLFGPEGVLRQATGGTVYLYDIDHLSRSQQYGLYQVMRTRSLPETDGKEKDPKRDWPVNVRVMASAEKDLNDLAAQGKFLPELAWMFGGLVLTVPPLRERPEDLAELLAKNMRRADEQLGTYHVLAEDAKETLLAQHWSGNVLQVEAFCGRLAAEISRRTIHACAALRLYHELYPREMPEQPAEKETGPVLRSEEEERIRAAWIRQDGNRQRMAQELGISTATLWRRIRKYGLDDETIRE